METKWVAMCQSPAYWLIPVGVTSMLKVLLLVDNSLIDQPQISSRRCCSWPCRPVKRAGPIATQSLTVFKALGHYSVKGCCLSPTFC